MSSEIRDPCYYYENFAIGQSWQTPVHLVGADEVRDYAEIWDPLPIHIDAKAAAASAHGGLIASGEHTFAIARRALWGVGLRIHATRIVRQDELRFPTPVRVGDGLTTKATCTEMRAPRAEGAGRVTLHLSVTNQDGTAVLTCIEILEVASTPGSTA
jgi:acyl dehydratase